MNSSNRSKLPVAACLIILGVAAMSVVGSDDPALILACGSVIALTVGLLWRSGEAPILLMAAVLQLSQVVILPLYANVLGVPLQTMSNWGRGSLSSAAWFALAGIVSLVVGMWCGQLGMRPQADRVKLESRAWSPRTAFVFCVVILVLSALFDVLAGFSEGLRQPALAASQIQWLGVFVLACVCTARRRGYAYLVFVIGFEMVRGFTGFFADFKDVFFVLLVGIFAARPKLKLGGVVAGLAVVSVLLVLGAFWSAVKENYRMYVSQGSYQQQVLVPVEDRLAFLSDQAFNIDSRTMIRGFDLLARRWGYIEFLAATMRNVPARLPFQDGAQVGAAVMHVLQPRLLFPDKPPLPSDTELAARYTGLPLNEGNNASATSISLGYLAELYVDFGLFGALAGAFLIGLLWGGIIKFIRASTSAPSIVNAGLAVMLMMSAKGVEQGIVKFVGAFLTTFIVLLLFRIFLLPFLLDILGRHAPHRLLRQVTERKTA